MSTTVITPAIRAIWPLALAIVTANLHLHLAESPSASSKIIRSALDRNLDNDPQLLLTVQLSSVCRDALQRLSRLKPAGGEWEMKEGGWDLYIAAANDKRQILPCKVCASSTLGRLWSWMLRHRLASKQRWIAVRNFWPNLHFLGHVSRCKLEPRSCSQFQKAEIARTPTQSTENEREISQRLVENRCKSIISQVTCSEIATSCVLGLKFEERVHCFLQEAVI
jgi:hypothetical protein